MANTTMRRGLDPEWHGSTPPLCVPVNIATVPTGGLFLGSAVARAGGGVTIPAATATGATTADTTKYTGSVVMLYDASGAPIHNLAAGATTVSIEMTQGIGQRYRCTMDNTAFTTTSQDQMIGLTAEAGVAGTAGSLTSSSMGSHYSTRQLAGASMLAKTSAYTRPLFIMDMTPLLIGNTAAVAGTELWVTINPASYVA